MSFLNLLSMRSTKKLIKGKSKIFQFINKNPRQRILIKKTQVLTCQKTCRRCHKIYIQMEKNPQNSIQKHKKSAIRKLLSNVQKFYKTALDLKSTKKCVKMDLLKLKLSFISHSKKYLSSWIKTVQVLLVEKR